MKLRNKKTGEIVESFEFGIRVELNSARKLACYSTLQELNEEWEDYEPLIKDEKIRKAVRAWAEVVGKEETFVVSYNAEYHDCCIYIAGLSSTAMIDLGIDLNISEGSYTIAELCGEEKE